MILFGLIMLCLSVVVVMIVLKVELGGYVFWMDL